MLGPRRDRLSVRVGSFWIRDHKRFRAGPQTGAGFFIWVVKAIAPSVFWKWVNDRLLSALLALGYVPVVGPVTISHQGEVLNVDGDRAATAIGAVLEAGTPIILSYVPGVLCHCPDESIIVPHNRPEQAEEHLVHYAKGRMKNRLLGASEALIEGVERVIIADGRVTQPSHRALVGQGTVIAEAVL